MNSTLKRIIVLTLVAAPVFGQHARFSIERYRPDDSCVLAVTFAQGTPLDVTGNFLLTSEVTSATIANRVYESSSTGYISFDPFQSGAPSMEPANPDDVSVTAWCTRLSTASATGPFNVYKSGGADRGFVFFSSSNYFYLYNTGNTGYFSVSISEDTPVFVCLTCSSSDNTTRVYVNGTQVNSQVQAAGKVVRYHASEVGSIGKGHTYAGACKVDEVRYYTRTLTYSEVAQMYEEGPHR